MKQFNLIVVDAGASKKIDSLAMGISDDYEFNIVQCHKVRDVKTGKIIKVEVYTTDLEDLPCIIVDDIADGAASFIYCVKELQKIKGYKNSFLIVTHGIFSQGFNELYKYFDGIYCTNSYQDITFPWNMKGYLNRNSKQLNVF